MKAVKKKVYKLTRSIIDDNIDAWKQITNCKIRFDEAAKAIAWVKLNGNFSATGTKNFKTAMSIDASNNLEAAFEMSLIIGIICQESSFGTNFNNSGAYKGVFQLAQIVIDEFNHNNPANNITFPGDIDDLADLEKASRVSAWYHAMNLQRLTKSSSYVNPVKNITEANKFAIASYNGGPTLVKNAREITAETLGGEREIWDKVKVNLEAAGASTAKANEIRNYVDFVAAYAAKSNTCWCNDCGKDELRVIANLDLVNPCDDAPDWPKAAAPSKNPLATMAWATGTLKDKFGCTRESMKKFHAGIDIKAAVGTICFAIEDAKVEAVAFGADLGKFVTISFKKGNKIFGVAYCHLKKTLVNEGDTVKAGDKIGETGITGNADAANPHLHLEIQDQIWVGYDNAEDRSKHGVNPNSYI